MHVSKNRLSGSLADAPLVRLLEACHRNLLTGAIRIQADGKEGALQLRAGAVDEVKFGDLTGDWALERLKALKNGTYELTQRLPDLSGALGSAAMLDGDVTDVPINAIMRHCEDNALSCTLVVVNGYDRGEIVYRAGDLKSVSLNGKRDDDAVDAIVGWKDARFRVQLPPLDPLIDGWPAVTSDPTAPFRVEDAVTALRAPGPPAPIVAVRAAPSPSPGPKVPHVQATIREPEEKKPFPATRLFLVLLLLGGAALTFAELRYGFVTRWLRPSATATAAPATGAPATGAGMGTTAPWTTAPETAGSPY